MHTDPTYKDKCTVPGLLQKDSISWRNQSKMSRSSSTVPFCSREFHIGFNSPVSCLTPHDKTTSPCIWLLCHNLDLTWNEITISTIVSPAATSGCVPCTGPVFWSHELSHGCCSISKCLTVFHWNTSLAISLRRRGEIHTCTILYMHSWDDFSSNLTFQYLTLSSTTDSFTRHWVHSIPPGKGRITLSSAPFN